MDRIKQGHVSTAREFFSTELKTVMERHQIQTKYESFEYLVDLLTRFIDTEKFYARSAEGKLEENYLITLYGQYLEADAASKVIILRRLGDVCLFVTGFFADSLSRKLVDVDYYAGMGGTAYWQLSMMHPPFKPLYQELSQKFKSLSGVLEEMSERSGMQSNTNLLRLYEKWLITGSDRLKSVLASNGIPAPVKIDKNQKH
jgi:hypothetical protein